MIKFEDRKRENLVEKKLFLSRFSLLEYKKNLFLSSMYKK